MINLKLPKGSRLGLLGKNGAGKSTLMQILSTLEKPDAGSVLIDCINAFYQIEEARSKIAFLPDYNPLPELLYVKEFLVYQQQIFDCSSIFIEQLIEKTQLQDVLNQKIQNLSKGFRQRLGIANLLLSPAEIYILDEPLAGLDTAQRIEIRGLINSISKSKTMIFSSHMLGEIEYLADQIAIVHDGEIVYHESFEHFGNYIKVCFDYRVEEAFLKRIEKVDSVENIRDFEYKIKSADNTNVREELLEFARKHGLEVLEMQWINSDLEEKFLTLTSSKKTRDNSLFFQSSSEVRICTVKF
ncbi:MAG: gliding motility-associated ABC transporter ATP-binding subunit GldA [Flavobacteriaceae bacterium]|nr:gliding motility-associated ABC transporter ATP-binding subunit GldA [Flavobacteriaceae bacterium]